MPLADIQPVMVLEMDEISKAEYDRLRADKAHVFYEKPTSFVWRDSDDPLAWHHHLVITLEGKPNKYYKGDMVPYMSSQAQNFRLKSHVLKHEFVFEDTYLGIKDMDDKKPANDTKPTPRKQVRK